MERFVPMPKQQPTKAQEKVFIEESDGYGGTEKEGWSDYTKPDPGSVPYCDKGDHKARSEANRGNKDFDNWGYD